MTRRAQSLFLFPVMPAADRQLILALGDVLMQTRGRYRQAIESTIKMVRAAADAEPPCACEQPGPFGFGRMLRFKVRPQ